MKKDFAQCCFKGKFAFLVFEKGGKILNALFIVFQTSK